MLLHSFYHHLPVNHNLHPFKLLKNSYFLLNIHRIQNSSSSNCLLYFADMELTDLICKTHTHTRTYNLSYAYSVTQREIKWSNHLISLFAITNLWFAVINKSDYFELGRKVLGFINADLEVAHRQTSYTVVIQDKIVEPSRQLDALGLFLPQQAAAVFWEAPRLFALNSERFWCVPSSALTKYLSALLLRVFYILLLKKWQTFLFMHTTGLKIQCVGVPDEMGI
jgi:hypothetical protein